MVAGVEQGGQGRDEAGVGDLDAGPGEGEPLVVPFDPTGGLEQGRRGDIAPQFADQADLGGDPEPGLPLARQPLPEPARGLSRVQLTHRAARRDLDLRGGVER